MRQTAESPSAAHRIAGPLRAAGRISTGNIAGRPSDAHNPGMSSTMTLTDIKAAEAARRQEQVDAMKPGLVAYARAHGGRFWLFGSAARRDMRYHSDVDILVDFPEHQEAYAWNAAERACWDRGLTPDLMRRSWCKQAFLDHIAPDMELIA
jgi:hypothetical protein